MSATVSRHGARRRWIALIVVCVGALMTILDTTVVNVALPAIQDDLGFGGAGLAWVVNAYLIAFGGLLLLAGRLGDLVGHRRVFLAGVLLFGAASAACGLAPSQGVLVGARFVQGAGGALTSAVILGMVVRLFPEPGEQARAIGVYSFFQAAGGSLGLLLGGALTQAVGWHWIFQINVPLALGTALAAARLLDADRAPGLRDGTDAVGALLVVAALMTGVSAITGVESHGLGSARTLGPGGVAAVLLAAFAAREARAATPLVPLRLLRSRTRTGANLVLGLLVAGLFTMQFLVPLYLGRILGFGPLAIGLAFLPLPVAIAALSLGATGRLIVRFGTRATLLGGVALIAAGLGLLARAPAAAAYAADVLPPMLVLGAGGGLALPALMSLAMADAGEDAGLASGLANTTVQVGGALGLATLVALSAARTEGLRASGASAAEALLGGYHLGFAIAAGLGVAAAAAAALVLRGYEARRSAPRSIR